MKWWADWLADNPRDHARPPGLTNVDLNAGRRKLVGTFARRPRVRRWLLWESEVPVSVDHRLNPSDTPSCPRIRVAFKYKANTIFVFVLIVPFLGCSPLSKEACFPRSSYNVHCIFSFYGRYSSSLSHELDTPLFSQNLINVPIRASFIVSLGFSVASRILEVA
jgi:hypothetical protein